MMNQWHFEYSDILWIRFKAQFYTVYMSWVYLISALIWIYFAFIQYIEFTALINVDKIYYIIRWDNEICAAQIQYDSSI